MKLQCMVPWLGTCRGSCLYAIQGQTSCGPTPGVGWSRRLTGTWLIAQARVTWSVGCDLGKMPWQAHSRRKCTGLCLMMSVTSGPQAGTRSSCWFASPNAIRFGTWVKLLSWVHILQCVPSGGDLATPACVDSDACAADLSGALPHLTCLCLAVRQDSQSIHLVLLATARRLNPLLTSHRQACTCMGATAQAFHHLCRSYACLLMVKTHHCICNMYTLPPLVRLVVSAPHGVAQKKVCSGRHRMSLLASSLCWNAF